VTKLPWEWADERLAAAWNYWLATTSAEGPHVRPVWCLWHDGSLLFTTSRTSRMARDFLVDPRVAVHPELVREVVVVEGTVEPAEPDAEAVGAYERKYTWRPPAAQEWFAVRPISVYAADEATYPASATRFTVAP
jgi:nitroimidazol reductase NimA-like FMN-containing flavoprotein (pyridoxamine 5'-phosphate oxidase superfamily)